MSINSDHPFAQMVLPTRITLPKKITQEAKEKGDIRRRIEYLEERAEFEREWGKYDD
ncbi:hypothetical protein [Vibrio sp. TBV020]|uniref:hypothetical protein n=1 Tax=Vibrio sp. TBV020 TaxID=3137398 RepID=UPI0038CD3A7A